MSARRSVLAAFALLLGSLISAPSLAQDRDAARAAFQGGVESYSAGRFTEALESFQAAYRIAPHPSVRVNMANCYEGLGRPVEALNHFERFLIESENPAPAQDQEVRAAITRLQQEVGEVFFDIEPDGATVTIDDETTLTAPILDGIKLSAGPHTIRVTRPGHTPYEQRIEVAGGARRELPIYLEEGIAGVDVGVGAVETTIEEPAQEEEGEGGRIRLTTPVLIAGGATAVLGLSALIVGIMAIGSNSTFDDAVVDSNNPMLSRAERADARQRGLDAEAKANGRAIVADILGIGALVAGGATVVFLLLSRNGDDEEDVARTTLSPTVSPDRVGLQLQGSF
ncbi:MAG: hypothetical protein ACI9KE_004814 [Polyangiales bacterium]|jgi:hypothetical protein